VAIFLIETNRGKDLEVFGEVYCRYPSAWGNGIHIRWYVLYHRAIIFRVWRGFIFLL